jgi:SAM-dependent methyltransferase
MAENYFGPHIAEIYDTRWANLSEPSVLDPAVNFLAGLAGTGSALEFGIGTGRVALPLSRLGVQVHGIELSADMVAQLRAKPGAGAIGVTIGDFAVARVDGTFGLAYLLRNTIMNLTTRDAQVACFATAARQLDPGGWFVIEVMVPELRRLPPGETVRPFEVTPAHLGFDEYDPATQGLISHHYWTENGRTEAWSVPFRYVWPAELDLMARLAGMRLSERWSDWDRTPFTGDSRSHVSVWQKD